MRGKWAHVGVFLLLALACRERLADRGAPPTETYGSGVLSTTSSPFHAVLTTDGDVFHLLTARAAFRIEPGRPPVETPIALGFGATTTPSSLVFWSGGAVLQAPRGRGGSGGAPRRLLALPDAPQLFVAAGEAVAWLARAGDRFSLETSTGTERRTLYSTRGTIEAVTTVGEWIFFVERTAGAGWRIGRVPIAGGSVAFTPAKTGRTPAMLAGRRDLVYYDGNGYEVRRLSLDLHQETTVARDIVCSPLAVARSIYCAQVEGIVELKEGSGPRRIAATPRPITTLAASDRRLLWVIDAGAAGADQLEVRALDLD